MRAVVRWLGGMMLGTVMSVAWGESGLVPVEPPEPPPVLHSGEPLEPEVTIRETRTEKIYEYRLNGRLVMVRVQPRVGPPYYFVDRDGDGELEYTRDDPTKGPNVNQWILFRW